VALTTPGRPVDLTDLFPELAGYERTATRLHPKAGSPTVTDSSVGGPLLWPADEPWPTCPGPHDTGEGQGVALVALAQLYVRDIPDLKAPAGMDVLQVLWCPFDHYEKHIEGPAVVLCWRDSSTVGALLDEPPQPAEVEYEQYLPKPCVLHPERITEYPRAVHLHEELDRDLCDRIAAWCREAAGVAPQDADPELSWTDAGGYDAISATDRWKVGGWPFWSFRDPWTIRCAACETVMAPLLQVGSGEMFSDLDYWTPVEDLDAIEASPLPLWKFIREFGNQAGVELGRGYRLQVWVCPESEAHPLKQLLT
jgi:hypothetical protein